MKQLPERVCRTLSLPHDDLGQLAHTTTPHVPSRRATTRRGFLAAAAGLGALVALDPGRALGTIARPRGNEPAPRAIEKSAPDLHHLAWVWQFEHDGEAAAIRDVLSAHGLGIAMKTHDGTDWMSRFDATPEAISGPERVTEVAAFFEAAGVPFYAWTVVEGLDPLEEARMAAAVLGAGARGLFLDLEPHPGFWRGSPATARTFMRALRLLQPTAWVATSVDPRPWELPRIPLAEFAAYTDAIAPQVYWQGFSTQANVDKFRLAGEDPGAAGVTPRFALDSAIRNLEPFGLPIHPIGDGTVDDDVEWGEFLDVAYDNAVQSVSVWRFGVVDDGVWSLLRDTPPQTLAHIVQPGDTLGAIAASWRTSVTAVAEANGIKNPDFLYIGQVVRNPRADALLSGAPLVAPDSDTESGSDSDSDGGSSSDGTTSDTEGSAGSSGTYTVEAGDTLWDLAVSWGTTIDEIAAINGIADPSLIVVGTELRIP